MGCGRCDDLLGVATIGKGSPTDSAEEQANGTVLLIIRDGHDDGATGMHSRLAQNTRLKHAFDSLRQRSCKNCRPRDTMLFERSGISVTDDVLSEEVRFAHGREYEVKLTITVVQSI